jgi:hypothetical protein
LQQRADLPLPRTPSSGHRPAPAQVCRYRASGVLRDLFERGNATGGFLFPLETSRVVEQYPWPWEARFGPGEGYEQGRIALGAKLPCRYSYAPDGAVEYEKHHACDVSGAAGGWHRLGPGGGGKQQAARVGGSTNVRARLPQRMPPAVRAAQCGQDAHRDRRDGAARALKRPVFMWAAARGLWHPAPAPGAPVS